MREEIRTGVHKRVRKKTLTTILSNQARIDTTSLGSGGGVPNSGAKVGRSLDSQCWNLGLSLLLLLPLDFLRVTVEEHVNHNVPAGVPGDRST